MCAAELDKTAIGTLNFARSHQLCFLQISIAAIHSLEPYSCI